MSQNELLRSFNKNDVTDAEAIVEAASRPSMHFVPIKQVEQQDIQSSHRVRSPLVKNRTALINEIRGLNLEYGIAIPMGAKKFKTHLLSIICGRDNSAAVVVNVLGLLLTVMVHSAGIQDRAGARLVIAQLMAFF